MLKIKRICAIFIASAFMVTGSTTEAAVYLYELDTSFLGGPPSGASPWATAAFDDSAGPNTVRLTMTASPNLSAGESISFFNFNYSADSGSSFDSSGLFLDYISGPKAFTSFQSASQNIPIPGDGFANLAFAFIGTFTAGQSVIYDISSTGILASNFNFLTAPDGINTGDFYTTATLVNSGGTFLANIGDGNGASVPAPEPATALILGGMMASSAYMKRRKEAKKG